MTPDPTAPDERDPDAAPTSPKTSRSRRSRAIDAAPHDAWDPLASDDWTEEDVLAEAAAAHVSSTELAGSAPAVPERSTWLPLVEGHSPRGAICPFLRAVSADDIVGFPIEMPDPSNRCAALTDVVPQSLRQQELVCLTGSHVNCPRYLRGAIEVSSAPVARARIVGKPALTPAIAASLGILALSFAASVVFGLANGGLVLPSHAIRTQGPAASSSAVAIASPSPVATAAGGSATPASPSPSASPSASPSPVPSASPTALSTARPTLAPTPKPTAKPPRSNRFDLLTKCPGRSDCWIYHIRSGDNLFSIANYFGVSLDRVKAMNPWTKTQRLSAGRELLIPTPTR